MLLDLNSDQHLELNDETWSESYLHQDEEIWQKNVYKASL